MPEQLYVATANRHKIEEIARVLAPFGLDVRSGGELGDISVQEDGKTFLENARKKLAPCLALTDAWALADDSGLEVPALGGAPGVHSHRYASTESGQPSDAANNARLLREMRAFAGDQRRARFVCAMALGRNGREVHVACGFVEGVILTEPRGSGGFGYDPLFFYPELGKTFAELAPEEKNRVSHRGRALRSIARFLSAAPTAAGRRQ